MVTLRATIAQAAPTPARRRHPPTSLRARTATLQANMDPAAAHTTHPARAEATASKASGSTTRATKARPRTTNSIHHKAPEDPEDTASNHNPTTRNPSPSLHSTKASTRPLSSPHPATTIRAREATTTTRRRRPWPRTRATSSITHLLRRDKASRTFRRLLASKGVMSRGMEVSNNRVMVVDKVAMAEDMEVRSLRRAGDEMHDTTWDGCFIDCIAGVAWWNDSRVMKPLWMMPWRS